MHKILLTFVLILFSFVSNAAIVHHEEKSVLLWKDGGKYKQGECPSLKRVSAEQCTKNSKTVSEADFHASWNQFAYSRDNLEKTIKTLKGEIATIKLKLDKDPEDSILQKLLQKKELALKGAENKLTLVLKALTFLEDDVVYEVIINEGKVEMPEMELYVSTIKEFQSAIDPNLKEGDYAVYEIEVEVSDGIVEKAELKQTVKKITSTDMTIKHESCTIPVSNRRCIEKEETIDLKKYKQLRLPEEQSDSKIINQGTQKITVGNTTFDTKWVEATLKKGNKTTTKAWWVQQFPGFIKVENYLDANGFLFSMVLKKVGSAAK